MADLAEILHRLDIDTTTLRRRRIAAGRRGEVYSLVVPQADALATWAALRNVVGQTGHWPLCLGEEDLARDFMPYLFVDDEPEGTTLATGQENALDDSYQELLAEGLRLDPIVWVDDRYEQAPDYRRSQWDEDPGPGRRFEDYGEAARPTLAWFWGEPSPVHLALLPVTESWQVPAYLHYGYTNECPTPEEHVCMMHSWHERFGAELVWLFQDAVGMHVNRPPTDRATALALAKEHLVYCPSIEEASCIESLAGVLHGATAWRFWWD